MKKILFLLAAVLTFSACTDEYVTEMNRIVWDFEVVGGTWDASSVVGGDNYRFTKSFSFSQLNDHIYNNGTVIAYFEYPDGPRNYQQPLPVVYPRQLPSNPAVTWTEVINFDYTAGEITFFVTNDDFDYSNFNGDPGTMRFRVVMIW